MPSLFDANPGGEAALQAKAAAKRKKAQERRAKAENTRLNAVRASAATKIQSAFRRIQANITMNRKRAERDARLRRAEEGLK